MKKCSTCKTFKAIEFFSKNRSAKDGLSYHCKPCCLTNNLKSAKANPETYKSTCRKNFLNWKNKNLDKFKKIAKCWQQDNSDKCAKYNSKWKKENPGKWNAIAAKYRAAKINATPQWITKEQLNEIEEFYVLAHDLAWLNNGEVLSVDHIVPLQGKAVSGLHVPWNLQLLPKTVNSSKGNR